MLPDTDIEEIELEPEQGDNSRFVELPESVRFGRYDLVRRLGSGGMATVYLGRDPDDGLYAIKVFQHHGSDPQSFARFRREYLALSRLSHPNIVGVKDAGLQDGKPWFAMEFVEGHDLKAEASALAAFPPEERFQRITDLFVQLCEALDYIHGSGLVHRDLKPSNVLVTPEGQVKLTDFGIARDLLTSVHLTGPGQFLGTVTHIAPEQIQGHAVDHRADLYSLGVLLYELLTRRRPFKATDNIGYAYLHVHRAPPPPRSVDPDIPPALEEVALKLLLKNPADRFQSGEAAIAALEGREAGELVPPERRPDQVPWVGRDRDVRGLSLLLKPSDYPGHLVLVEGPWGVGKTRLLREVLLRMPLEGVGVFEGRCAEGSRPYEGLYGLVSGMVQEVREGKDKPGRQLLQRVGADLAWAFPGVVDAEPEPVIEPRMERYRIATAMMDLIVWLAVRRPRLLFIDDIHRSDRATRELVTYMAVQLAQRRIPVMFVVSSEPSDAPPLPLLGPEHKELVTRVAVRPMPHEDMHTLARLLMGEGALKPIDEMARGAQGRPAFLIELVDAWRRLQAEDDTDPALPPIPPRVREAILQSIEDIHMPGVEILALLAALGREATSTFLRQVLVIREDILKERLARLEREGWLGVRQWEGAEQWDLPSWVSRRVLYETLAEASRQDLHARLARALSRKKDLSPDDLASMAEQLHLAGRFDEAWPHHLNAAEVLLDRRSARAALLHLNSAEEIADRLTVGDRAMALREDRARLLRLKGRALFCMGQTRPGLDALRASLRLSERLGTPEIVATARLAVGNSLLALGHHAEADKALKSAARAWREASDELGLGATLVAESELSWAIGRPGRSEEPIREALALANRHNDRSLRANALQVAGLVSFGRGDGKAAMDALASAEVEYRSIHARPGLATCLAARAEIGWWLGELGVAIVSAEEAVKVARETDMRLALAQSKLVIGLLQQEMGQWDDAAATFEQVVSLSRRPGYAELTAAARVGRAWVALGRGDPGSALTWLVLPRKQTQGGWCQALLACRAWALAALGQTEEAQATLRSIEDSPGPLAPRVILRVAMGWAALMMGNVDEARHLAYHALKRAERMGLRPTALHAYLLLQAAALQVGDENQAGALRVEIEGLVEQLIVGLPPEQTERLRARPDLLLPDEAAA